MTPRAFTYFRYERPAEVVALYCSSDAARTLCSEELSVTDYFERLMACRLVEDAVRFLSWGLGEKEGIAWACRCNELSLAQNSETTPEDTAAWTSAKNWLESDGNASVEPIKTALADSTFQTSAAWCGQSVLWTIEAGQSAAEPGIAKQPPPKGIEAAVFLAIESAQPTRSAEQKERIAVWQKALRMFREQASQFAGLGIAAPAVATPLTGAIPSVAGVIFPSASSGGAAASIPGVLAPPPFSWMNFLQGLEQLRVPPATLTGVQSGLASQPGAQLGEWSQMTMAPPSLSAPTPGGLGAPNIATPTMPVLGFNSGEIPKGLQGSEFETWVQGRLQVSPEREEAWKLSQPYLHAGALFACRGFRGEAKRQT